MSIYGNTHNIKSNASITIIQHTTTVIYKLGNNIIVIVHFRRIILKELLTCIMSKVHVFKVSKNQNNIWMNLTLAGGTPSLRYFIAGHCQSLIESFCQLFRSRRLTQKDICKQDTKTNEIRCCRILIWKWHFCPWHKIESTTKNYIVSQDTLIRIIRELSLPHSTTIWCKEDIRTTNITMQYRVWFPEMKIVQSSSYVLGNPDNLKMCQQRFFNFFKKG